MLGFGWYISLSEFSWALTVVFGIVAGCYLVTSQHRDGRSATR
jgi:hypothetical protein